jgi:hypothetical protein
VSTPRPRYPEAQQQQRELENRRALEQLVEFLVNAASDAWHDQRLWGHGDRARYFGRSVDLVTAVDKLSKAIREHPDAGVRADRLSALHDVLEAAAIIGGCLKTPATRRLRPVAATEAKLVEGHQRDEVLVEVASAILRKHPTWKSCRRIADEGHARFNELLKAQGLRKMERDTISGHLGRLWPRLVSPPED